MVEQEISRDTIAATYNRLRPYVRRTPVIEAAGLKSFSIGGAQVSPMHANYIVNTDGATASDVKQLIEHAEAALSAAKQGGRGCMSNAEPCKWLSPTSVVPVGSTT